MAELQTLLTTLAKTTTKKGNGMLEKEIKKLQEGQKQHHAQLGKC